MKMHFICCQINQRARLTAAWVLLYFIEDPVSVTYSGMYGKMAKKHLLVCQRNGVKE